MPLINCYVKQDIEFGNGELLGFDFERIESDLRDALMPSLQPIAIAIGEFSFSVSFSSNYSIIYFYSCVSDSSTLFVSQGELKETGGLKLVSEKIKQEDLPSSVLDQV